MFMLLRLTRQKVSPASLLSFAVLSVLEHPIKPTAKRSQMFGMSVAFPCGEVIFKHRCAIEISRMPSVWYRKSLDPNANWTTASFVLASTAPWLFSLNMASYSPQSMPNSLLFPHNNISRSAPYLTKTRVGVSSRYMENTIIFGLLILTTKH